MRPPGPRDSSFSIPSSDEFLDWASLASSLPEFFATRATLHGVPHGWIEWVERQTVATVKRGIVVQEPLRYRLAMLLNGIILLQEAKYVADLFENAIRFAFVRHASDHGIRFGDLSPTIPGAKDLRARLSKPGVLTRDAVLHLTFYQLTDTIARNWKRVGAQPFATGFRFLFWANPCCRDVHAFRRDTATIRDVRNTIAHSKQLLTSQQVQSLYRTSSQWLAALDVNAAERIRSYRDRRPRFLSDLKHV